MTVHCEVPRLGCRRESQSVLVRGVSCVLRIPSLKKFVSCAHLTLVINRYVQQIPIACNIFVVLPSKPRWRIEERLRCCSAARLSICIPATARQRVDMTYA